MATMFSSPSIFLPETPPEVALRDQTWDFLTSEPTLPLPELPGVPGLPEHDSAASYLDCEAQLLGFCESPKQTELNLFEDAFVAEGIPPLNASEVGGRSAKKRKNTSTSNLRVRKACDACHFRKTKCDNQRPCGPCTAFGKTCTDGTSEDRKRRARSNIKKLADKLNRHRGQPCTRQEGCLRPFRHPGHCRKGPARKRKRKSKYLAEIEAAERKERNKLLTKPLSVLDWPENPFAMLERKEEEAKAEGSDVPEVDIQELAEAQSSQETWMTESQSSQEDTFW